MPPPRPPPPRFMTVTFFFFLSPLTDSSVSPRTSARFTTGGSIDELTPDSFSMSALSWPSAPTTERDVSPWCAATLWAIMRWYPLPANSCDVRVSSRANPHTSASTRSTAIRASPPPSSASRRKGSIQALDAASARGSQKDPPPTFVDDVAASPSGLGLRTRAPPSAGDLVWDLVGGFSPDPSWATIRSDDGGFSARTPSLTASTADSQSESPPSLILASVGALCGIYVPMPQLLRESQEEKPLHSRCSHGGTPCLARPGQ